MSSHRQTTIVKEVNIVHKVYTTSGAYFFVLWRVVDLKPLEALGIFSVAPVEKWIMY